MKVYMCDGRVISFHWNSYEARVIRGLMPPVVFGHTTPFPKRKVDAMKKLAEMGIIKVSGNLDDITDSVLAELLVEKIAAVEDLGEIYVLYGGRYNCREIAEKIGRKRS